MGAEDEALTIVLSGTVFISDHPLLIDAYMLEVHKIAPYAKMKLLHKKPVMGAYYMTCDRVK